MKKGKSTKQLVEEIIKKYGTDDISISWEGGNDEGTYRLSIGGKDIDFYRMREDSDEYALIDDIAGKIGYYGFAGDFFANGEVSYYAPHKAFIGEDTYEENKEKSCMCNIKIKIPEYLWFDSLFIECSGSGECPDISCRLIIDNGPVFEEHLELEKDIVSLVESSIYSTLNKITCPSEVNSVYIDVNERRNSLQRDSEGNLYYTIDEFIYYEYETDGKEVSIPIS